MPLTLVLGPANSAKAGEVLGAYAAAAHRGALLVVPTAQDAAHYTRELVETGDVLGSALTFGGLAAEVARRAGYHDDRLSTLQRERVLRRAIGGVPLHALARSAAAPGFVGAAGGLIAELQRSLVTPQRFAAALEAWAAQDERRAPYSRELASLYFAYRRELDRLGSVDAELYAWRALDALRAQPGRWGQAPVFFYGFDDLDAIERDAVETLSRVAGVEVTVSLTYESTRAALSARAEVVAELRSLASAVRELPASDEHYRPDSREALHHLERSLFEPAPERVDPGAAVHLLEAGGELAEAELVAAEVLALLRAGVPGEEIVVVYRSLARAAPAIERVFRRYGIALASAHRVAFVATTLGRSVLALARCALLGDDHAPAGELVCYLRSPGVLERIELADALEADVRREGLRTAGQARARLGWALGEIDALRSARDLPSELARQARRLLAAPHRGLAPALSAAEALDARALAVLLRALAELDQLGERLSRLELLELLEDLDVPAGPLGSPGAVLLAEPLGIRARRFRAVFVCGLSESEFPAPERSEPFLSDERRRELAFASGLRLAPRDDARARERYLFYACVSRATERVVLSWRSSDEEGNLALPSPFIADVAELFVGDWFECRRRRLLADIVWAPEEAPTPREFERSLAAGRAELNGRPPAGGRPEGAVSHSLGEAALAHVRHTEVVSAGALEIFAACPMRWLVERELSPASFEPEPDALARGSFMHAALEAVIDRLAGPVTPESLPVALRILDEVMAELPARIAPGAPEALRMAAVGSIEADLRRYLAHEAADACDWIPHALELRFGFAGEPESLPPITLGEGDHRVRLRGVIDRVDVDPGGRGTAIVRDYKSGAARPEQQGARWRCDRQLQVALYMLVVRELLGLAPVAGLYQPLGGGDLQPRRRHRRPRAR